MNYAASRLRAHLPQLAHLCRGLFTTRNSVEAGGNNIFILLLPKPSGALPSEGPSNNHDTLLRSRRAATAGGCPLLRGTSAYPTLYLFGLRPSRGQAELRCLASLLLASRDGLSVYKLGPRSSFENATLHHPGSMLCSVGLSGHPLEL